MLKIHDVSELGYGGLVALAEWQDDKRMAKTPKPGEKPLTEKDLARHFSTWAYLIPGATATVMTGLGVMPRFNPITERLAHGFIYDFPRFIRKVAKAVSKEEARGGETAGTRMKREVMAEVDRILASRGGGALPPGGGGTSTRAPVGSRAVMEI